MHRDNTCIYSKYRDFNRNIDFGINSIHVMYRNRKLNVFSINSTYIIYSNTNFMVFFKILMNVPYIDMISCMYCINIAIK